MSHLSKSKVSFEEDPLSLFGAITPPTSSSASTLSPPPSSSVFPDLFGSTQDDPLKSINEDPFKDFDDKSPFVEFTSKYVDEYSWINSFDTLFGTSLSSGATKITKNQQRILLLHIWQQRSSTFSDTPPSPLRGLLWRYFFELVSSKDTSTWGTEMQQMIHQYSAVKERVRPNIAKSSIDPLSALSQGLEPWADYDKIADLNSIIEKDLDRLYLTGMDDLMSYDEFVETNPPQTGKPFFELNFVVREFFQQARSREALHHVLFTWCMEDENLFLSYRQGMHELVGILYLILYQEQLHFFSLGLELMKRRHELIFSVVQELQTELGNPESSEELVDVDDLLKGLHSSPSSKPDAPSEKFLASCEKLLSFFQPSGIPEVPQSTGSKSKNLMHEFMLSPGDPGVLAYYKELFRVRIGSDRSFQDKLREKLAGNPLIPRFNQLLEHFYTIFSPHEFLIRLEAHTFFLFSKLMKEMLPLYDTQGVTINHSEWTKPGGQAPYSDGDYSPHSPQPFIVHYSSYIQYEFLPLFDRNVYSYLKECQIPSQVYALRWLRLLFSREFNVVEFNVAEYTSSKAALVAKNLELLAQVRPDARRMKSDFSLSRFSFFAFPSVEGILIKIWDILFASFFEYKNFLSDVTKTSEEKNDYYSLFVQACVNEKESSTAQDNFSDPLESSGDVSSLLSCVPTFDFATPASSNGPAYAVTPFIGCVGDIMLSMLLYLETSFYPNKDYSTTPDSSIAYMCLMKYPPFSLHATSTVNENGQEFQNFNDLWESISMIHRGVFVIKDPEGGNLLNFPTNSSLGATPAYSAFSISNSNSSTPPTSHSSAFASASKISSNIFSTLTEVNQNSKKLLSTFKTKVNNSLQILSPEFSTKKTSGSMKKTNWDEDDEMDSDEDNSDEERPKKDFYIKKNQPPASAAPIASSSQKPVTSSSSTSSTSFSSQPSYSSSVFNSGGTNSTTAFFSSNNKFNLFGPSSSTSYDSSVFSTPSPPSNSTSSIDIINKPFNLLASQIKNLTSTVSSTFTKPENDSENELADIISPPPQPVADSESSLLADNRRYSKSFFEWDYHPAVNKE